MYLVLNNKSPYYQLIYFRDSKRTSVSTCTSSIKEAEKFLASFKPQPVFKVIQQERQKPKPELKTVRIKLSNFTTEDKDYVRNTFSESYLQKAVTSSFNRLQNFLPDLAVNSISAKHIDQFISSVAATSKHAASLYYRTLKAAFNKAVIWNYHDKNPFITIKAPKVPKSFPIYISATELIQILNNTKYQFLKDIFATAFFSGLWLGELLSMNWSWINFDDNLITVKNSNSFITKSKKERIIPIHERVKEILMRRSSINMKSNFVFYRVYGIRLNEDFVSKCFKKSIRASKLNDDIHFHSLRHSFASNLVQRGVNLYVVKELLGHEDIKTTQVYSHLTQSSLSNAVNSL